MIPGRYYHVQYGLMDSKRILRFIGFRSDGCSIFENNHLQLEVINNEYSLELLPEGSNFYQVVVLRAKKFAWLSGRFIYKKANPDIIYKVGDVNDNGIQLNCTYSKWENFFEKQYMLVESINGFEIKSTLIKE